MENLTQVLKLVQTLQSRAHRITSGEQVREFLDKHPLITDYTNEDLSMLCDFIAVDCPEATEERIADFND